MAREDRAYIGWVKLQRCCVDIGVTIENRCGGGVEAHHAGPRPGMGMKAHDHTAIPLCAYHHACRHMASGVFKTMNRADLREWSDLQIGRHRAAYEKHQQQKEPRNAERI